MKRKEKIENKKLNNEVKAKRHFDPARGAVRIIALLLVIMMVVAARGTAIFYLVFSLKGLI